MRINVMCCPLCKSEYNRVLFTLMITSNDYQAHTITVKNDLKLKIDCHFKYPFNGRHNMHMLYVCSNGHIHFSSYDEHKGRVIVNENTFIKALADELNTHFTVDERLYLFNEKSLYEALKQFVEKH